MSYLTETATLEYETSGNNCNYEYHLPHTKTIDLIGEEFAPKRSQNQQQPSVIVETIDTRFFISLHTVKHFKVDNIQDCYRRTFLGT